jgi:hypothetical protein
MARKSCAVCGGRQMTSRMSLSYRGFPLGPFRVRVCCDCGEAVFDSAAWSAMRAVDHAIVSGGDHLTLPIQTSWKLGFALPGSSQLAGSPLKAVRFVQVGSTSTSPIRAPDTVKLVTLPALG